MPPSQLYYRPFPESAPSHPGNETEGGEYGRRLKARLRSEPVPFLH